MHKDFTAIVLAGGKSHRMGREKALLPIGDKTIIDIIIDKLKPLFPEIILSTNKPNDFLFLKIKMVEDFYKNAGPLGGIHAGLVESQTEKNLVISCDLPLMETDLINFICNFDTDKKITVCKIGDYIEPTFGVYSKSIVDDLEILLNLHLQHGLDVKELSVHNLIDKVGAEIIDPTYLPFYNDDVFYNMNTFEDYLYVSRKLGLLNKIR